jgi:hypothetical protein
MEDDLEVAAPHTHAVTSKHTRTKPFTRSGAFRAGSDSCARGPWLPDICTELVLVWIGVSIKTKRGWISCT